MQLLLPGTYEISDNGDGDDIVSYGDKQIEMIGVSKIFSQQVIGTLGAAQESFCHVHNSLQ
jgi:hypothetical protein